MTKYDKIQQKKTNVPKANEDVRDEAPKRLKQRVTAKPVKKKRGLVDRIVTGMVGPDGVQGVGRYLTHDVILPAVKEIIVNSVTSGINMMIYGPDGQAPRSGYSYQRNPYNNSYRPRTNYNQRSTPASGQTNLGPNPQPQRARRVNGFRSEDFIINDRNEAMDVLNDLRDQCNEYGAVSLADFYDLLGLETSYADNNYGWVDLTNSKVMVVRGGYALKLPRLDHIE